MARFYAQIAAVFFLVWLVAGLFAGNAAPVSSGAAGGNIGSVTLHMTWARDALNAVVLLVFVFIGLFASRSTGRYAMLAVSVLLFAIGIFGFFHGDNAQASTPVFGLNFPTTVNVIDTVVGLLGVLAALGTLSDDEAQPKSVLREGMPANQ